MKVARAQTLLKGDWWDWERAASAVLMRVGLPEPRELG